jgi:hypothetical protein
MNKSMLIRSILLCAGIIQVLPNTCAEQPGPLSYWGKNVSELTEQDHELNVALWQSYWDSRYIRFFSIFTSRLPKDRIMRMQKNLKIVNNTIAAINNRLDRYYGRETFSSQITDSNNISKTIVAHIVFSPFLLLEALFDASNQKNIDKMVKSRDRLCNVRDSLLYALKICKVEAV